MDDYFVAMGDSYDLKQQALFFWKKSLPTGFVYAAKAGYRMKVWAGGKKLFVSHNPGEVNSVTDKIENFQNLGSGVKDPKSNVVAFSYDLTQSYVLKITNAEKFHKTEKLRFFTLFEEPVSKQYFDKEFHDIFDIPTQDEKEELYINIHLIEIMLGILVIFIFYAIFKEESLKKEAEQMNATMI